MTSTRLPALATAKPKPGGSGGASWGQPSPCSLTGGTAACNSHPHPVPPVGSRWNSKPTLPARSMDSKVILRCSAPTTPVRPVHGQRFFPLDGKLHLRTDHWSDGAARVATRQGLQAASFDLAAAAFSEATGGSISGDSVRRITEAWGAHCEAARSAAAARANAPVQAGERPNDRRLPQMDPIAEQANVSTDGVMVLLRQEGWKEVKLTAISAVESGAVSGLAASNCPGHGADHSCRVRLQRHSYQAGFWDADTMALHQYAEGVRRGIDRCARLSSVNDEAAWIERMRSGGCGRSRTRSLAQRVT